MKLVSATEVISAGPEGIILESVLEGYAEYYSADLKADQNMDGEQERPNTTRLTCLKRSCAA